MRLLLRERRSGALPIGGVVSETLDNIGNCAEDAFRKTRRQRQLPEPRARASLQKGGDPEGGIRIALGAAGKSCFEVVARGGYAARTDFPRSLAIACRSI
jgi:hypothetical protein